MKNKFWPQWSCPAAKVMAVYDQQPFLHSFHWMALHGRGKLICPEIHGGGWGAGNVQASVASRALKLN